MSVCVIVSHLAKAHQRRGRWIAQGHWSFARAMSPIDTLSAKLLGCNQLQVELSSLGGEVTVSIRIREHV